MTHNNKYRNESTLVVDEEEYCLRPTFDALARIETSISTGSIEILLQETLKDKLSIGDASVVLSVLAEAGGNPIDKEALESYFLENGTGWVRVFLANEVLPKIVYGGKAYEDIMRKQLEAIGEYKPREGSTAQKKSRAPVR